MYILTNSDIIARDKPRKEHNERGRRKWRVESSTYTPEEHSQLIYRKSQPDSLSEDQGYRHLSDHAY